MHSSTGQTPTAQSATASTAPSTLHDPHAGHAARGLALVRDFLAVVTVGTVSDAHRKVMTDYARAPQSQDVQAILTAPIIDVLHAADGWHTASQVLDRALTVVRPHRWPRFDEATEPRSLDALAAAVASLLSSAETWTYVTPNTLADWAESQFLDEIHGARADAVRRARQA